MQENYGNKQEAAQQVRIENEILKMKLMLENGAEFHVPGEHDIDPFIENDFLNYIAAFERQAENAKSIRIFDKLKCPLQFRPVGEISDEHIGDAWQQLHQYMHDCRISLDVCSPNIGPRELYRFATEELFHYEMTDLDIPGMMTGFIYDEFYPDPVYDNTRTAIEECIRFIFQKQPIEWMYNFFETNLSLNKYSQLSANNFKDILNRFKNNYSDIVLNSVNCVNCLVNDSTSIVTGTYSALLINPDRTEMVGGEWRVTMLPDPSHGYWSISSVEIDGINF
jgi:hypothetical protein